MCCLFAFTGAALAGYGFASLMTAALVDTMIVGIGLTAYSTYQQGVAQKEANKANAEIAANQARAQELQAQEYERKAALEKEQAGLVQLQGEQEAAKRARQRAIEVGSTYATAAGNGLLVSGSDSDTFANVLKSQEIEARADINTIKANTAMEVWSREEEARSYLFGADQARYGVSNSLISSSNYRSQAKSAYNNGMLSAAGGALSSLGSAGVAGHGMAKQTGGYQWAGTPVK